MNQTSAERQVHQDALLIHRQESDEATIRMFGRHCSPGVGTDHRQGLVLFKLRDTGSAKTYALPPLGRSRTPTANASLMGVKVATSGSCRSRRAPTAEWFGEVGIRITSLEIACDEARRSAHGARIAVPSLQPPSGTLLACSLRTCLRMPRVSAASFVIATRHLPQLLWRVVFHSPPVCVSQMYRSSTFLPDQMRHVDDRLPVVGSSTRNLSEAPEGNGG